MANANQPKTSDSDASEMNANAGDGDLHGDAAHVPAKKLKRKKKTKGAKSAKKKPARPPKTFWGWVADIAAVGVWAGVGGLLVLAYFAMDLPTVDEAALTRQPNVVLLDTKGGELASFGDIYGDAVRYDELPFYVPAAIVAVEDRRFYEHFGLDPRGLVRAMVTNVKAGGIVQGGSTITQQVAKNLFLTPERTFSRKIREAMLALRLERQFSKEQILTLYMNRVYLGAGAYGVEGAARRYFGRPARELTLFQSAVLAGLLRAPSRYSPATNPEMAQERAEIVLAAMVDTHMLTRAQADVALKDAPRSLAAAKNAAPPRDRARYFADWVMSQVEGYAGVVDQDLRVQTTIDPTLQSTAEAVLKKHLDESGVKQNVSQGAIIVMSTDGAVRAMVGGKDYGESQFNRAVQAKRQPGSAFKPFVFIAALESGYSPDELVTDGPIAVAGWKPQNFSGTYAGPITVERALADSINTATVRLAQHAGPRAVIAAAHRMGIGSRIPNELSISLGSAEVTLLELTSSYAPFANGGQGIFPYAMNAITTRQGEVVYGRQGGGAGQVIAPATLAAMNRMLTEAVATGTGKAAAIGYPAAGKTGTSQDFRDAWFIGYTADFVCGVWVGNDSGEFMKRVSGGGLPARIWHDVMTVAQQDLPSRHLPGLAPPPPLDFISRFWNAMTGEN